ncbi:DsbC family protein [Halochromatium salexigens]|uniref:Thiol:disulfide interchange protein n=1 Tax=Halochromatium salexigens TaxID=49447 RepID=A0AAJ0XGH4_HALSE|nr:DsbC family protein [Halochromatium salexigens]MBK5931528.1 disulfide bond formation protein DsbC [Halochromatium salexigens]
MTTRFGLGMAAAAALLVASTALSASEAQTIREALAKVLPDAKPTSVQPTPIDGLFQVEIGPQVMYMTGDGRYLIDGAIVDLETRENLADAAQNKARLRAINALGEDEMIVFEAPNAEHEITVFTDIDCGYCRKLHQQIDAYAAEGISVRYLFYPRTGVDTPSYDKAVAVWCADDQQAAMTEAKNGQPVQSRDCNHPIERHMELAELMGIRGTPAIVLDNGQMVPGFVEPKRLAQVLEQQ